MKQLNSTMVVFPISFIGGHEKMALKHFVYSSEASAIFRVIRREEYKNSFLFLLNLCSSRLLYRKVLLISGSPFGHFLIKVLLKAIGYYVIEYTPFPELPEMKDKFYHYIVQRFNAIIVDERILIDDWQTKYSKVKINHVLKNNV